MIIMIFIQKSFAYSDSSRNSDKHMGWINVEQTDQLNQFNTSADQLKLKSSPF
jgi:hypothetical protein